MEKDGYGSEGTEYPPELHKARRASFLRQVELYTELLTDNELSPEDLKVIAMLKKIGSMEPVYPRELWMRRRTAFTDRAARLVALNVLTMLGSALCSVWSSLISWHHTPSLKIVRKMLVVAGILLAVLTGHALSGSRANPLTALPVFSGTPPAVHTFESSTEPGELICKNGYLPPLCLAQEVDQSQIVTNPGNGIARPAVAKDTVPGYGEIHRSDFVNDGVYGSAASWVSNSPNSWIKIDLGTMRPINTVAFGRDRIGQLNDGDPGQFLIAVARDDNVYANGDSSNDEQEYEVVYDSRQAGFDGTISGPETVVVQFALQQARFLKLTFENAGTAIDEVEAFVVDPTVPLPDLVQDPGWNFASATPSPTETSVPTIIATDTPLPTDTDTPLPPSDTPVPTHTETPLPPPTATPVPPPTDTPLEPTIEIIVPFHTPVPSEEPFPSPRDMPVLP